jgi:hypothetical protein
MTEPAKRTQPQGRDKHERPAATAMSGQERAATRQAGADDARRSRVRQGLPERIEDPAAVAVLAAILRDARAPPPRESRERKQQHKPRAAEKIITAGLRRSYEYV